MPKVLTPNEGAQRDFINSRVRAAAYIGGLGSGKTWAGLVRGLKFSQQKLVPGTLHGPRGLVAAINYRVLEDVVEPLFFALMDGAGLWKTGSDTTSWEKSKKRARLVANCGCADRRKCKHESVILFRSLDRPNWMRGVELSWFFIDEGRHVTRNAWNILWGRLRQKGYEHAGWVCSTPNGYDWMYDLFHPESDGQLEGAEWYGASTMANKDNLDDAYIKSLFALYNGSFLRQEVFGEFVGVSKGAVFFAFRPEAIQDVPYREDLELFTGWDFGLGDLNVVHFIQLDWVEKSLDPMSGFAKEYVPQARVIGYLEGSGRTSSEWAKTFTDYCQERFGARRPSLNIGDPAGRQRNQVTGTSVIEDLAVHGVVITPAPVKPLDLAFRIVNNMLEGGQLLVDREHALRVARALSSYRWPIDDDGNLTGSTPVHDWTSHHADALRYFALGKLGMFPKREKRPPQAKAEPGTVGHLIDQILTPVEEWLGPGQERQIDWGVPLATGPLGKDS